MKRATLFGLLASLLGLVGVIWLLAGGSHFPVYEWPYEAFQGVVFSVVWGFGLSVVMGYVVSLLIISVVLIACFSIGSKLSDILLGDNNQ
ncbi:hypothetical protein [Aliivibrio fischeri]|uniref:hypothetical protein n=1 Tax=Aliivibrio fischeri TaxID=668 RepID=UPI0012D9B66B|nr:hypothetical protein [Aliivibrio fischeri]MUK25852.1 hypothetical protein [Aliivibrio fischeri]MUK34183.1 hypothetical protein [Aliivibrio fischeri]